MSTPADAVNTPAEPASSTPLSDAAAQAAAAVSVQDSEIRELATQLAKPPYDFTPCTHRKGVIVDVSHISDNPGTVSITLSGDSTVIPGVTWLTSYSPAIGDVVDILKQDADICIIGKQASYDVVGPRWWRAVLNTGWSHNGDGQGDLYVRRTYDGSWKLEWQGAVRRTGVGISTTIITAAAMPSEFRTVVPRKVIAARGNGFGGGGSCAVQILHNPDGSLGIVGDVIAPASSASSVDPADSTNTSDAGWSNSSDSGWSNSSDSGWSNSSGSYSSVNDAGWSGGDSPLVTTGHSHYTGGHQHYSGDHSHYVGAHSHYTGAHSHYTGGHSHGVVGAHTHTITTTVTGPDWVSLNGVSYFP